MHTRLRSSHAKKAQDAPFCKCVVEVRRIELLSKMEVANLSSRIVVLKFSFENYKTTKFSKRVYF